MLTSLQMQSTFFGFCLIAAHICGALPRAAPDWWRSDKRHNHRESGSYLLGKSIHEGSRGPLSEARQSIQSNGHLCGPKGANLLPYHLQQPFYQARVLQRCNQRQYTEILVAIMPLRSVQ